MAGVMWMFCTTDVSRTSKRGEEECVIVTGLQHRIEGGLVGRMEILLENFLFPPRHLFSLSKTLVLMCRGGVGRGGLLTMIKNIV